MEPTFDGCTVEIVTDRSGCQLVLLKADGIYIPCPIIEGGALFSVNYGKVSNLHIRDDDVFIIGYSRSGTHWIHEMVGMILSGNTETMEKTKEFHMMDVVPIDELEKLPSPRLLNSHFWPKHVPRDIVRRKKVIYLLRNPKDVAVSYYHFVRSFKPPKGFGVEKYDGKFEDFLELFLQGKMYYGSWFEYVRAWEDVFNSEEEIDPIIVYYEDMKRDTVSELKRVADKIGISRSVEFLEKVAAACKINKMRENNEKREDVLRAITIDGRSSAYRKGVIGDWKHHFTVADNEMFDAVYKDKMKGSKLEFSYE